MDSLPSNIGKLYPNGNTIDQISKKKKGQISFDPSSFNNNNISMVNNQNNNYDNSKVYLT